MTERKQCYRLQVAEPLYRFIEEEALPGTGIKSDDFWRGFDAIVHDLTPINADLLAERARLQEELDNWHRLNIFLYSTTFWLQNNTEKIMSKTSVVFSPVPCH